MRLKDLSLLLALGLDGTPDAKTHLNRPDHAHDAATTIAYDEGSTERKNENNEMQAVEQNAAKHADEMEKEAGSIFQGLLAVGIISSAQATELVSAAEQGDEGKTEAVIQEINEAGHNDFNTTTLVISAIALLWFANMIRGCLKGKEISFIKHHTPFIMGLAAMATQAPGHVAHGLIESAGAFVAILVISRFSRGITNKVDFSQLTDEQARTALVVLGPLGSLITTPAISTVLAPLRERLKTDRDKYIAMHGVSNVDGGVAIGDFPFLYVWMQKGVVPGTLWQAELMLPIMAFHKMMQSLYLKVGPAQVIAHREVLYKMIKGFSFDYSRLKDSHDIKAEELALMQKFLAHIKTEIDRLKNELPPEVVAVVDELMSSQDPLKQDLAEGHGEGAETADSSEQLARLEALQAEVEQVIADPKNITEAVTTLRNAMADGRITREELERFHEAGHLDEIVKKVPGFQGVIKDLEHKANHIYANLCEKLKFSQNEAEIGRVFTAQALAIGLLIPAVAGVLQNAPMLTEPITLSTSATADNYAATAITWATHNSKALSLSIIAGALTIFGNMADLNFLGKDANLMKSVGFARYMIPTVTFAVMAVNDAGLGLSAVGGLAAAGAVKGVELARDQFKKRVSQTGEERV